MNTKRMVRHHIGLQEIITSIVLRSGMDMAESHVVSALANKRAEIAGMITRAQQQARPISR